MRTRFFADLLTAMKADSDIVLVTGDLGFGVLDPMVESCPNQVVNAGVAEQNMTGMAAGMALGGAKVFTYSIANFPTLRCLEQIRNDVAYHGADVTVVAVGGGLAYGALGMSHHATEDIAILRTIPSLAVAAPGDPEEVGMVLADILANGGPAYLRLGRAGERTVHSRPPRSARGEMLTVIPGNDIVLLSTGGMLPIAADAVQALRDAGHDAGLVSVPWIAPFDVDRVSEIAQDARLVVTVEEHSVVGGLGGATAETLTELDRACPLLRIGLPHRFESTVGDQAYLRALHGLTAEDIAGSIEKRLLSLDDRS